MKSSNSMSVDLHLSGEIETTVRNLHTGKPGSTTFTLSIESKDLQKEITMYFPHDLQGYENAMQLRAAVCDLVEKLTTNPTKETAE